MLRQRVKRAEITESEFRACEDGEAMRSLEARRLLTNGFDGSKLIHSVYNWIQERYEYWQVRGW